MMTSIAKKIPYYVAILFFAIASLASMLKGASISTAVVRGFLSASVSWVFAWLLAYIIFSDKFPEAVLPEGAEELDGKFMVKDRDVLRKEIEEKEAAKKVADKTPAKPAAQEKKEEKKEEDEEEKAPAPAPVPAKK
jgi:hypothetical protein